MKGQNKVKTDICIITSVHPREDARIYRRQALTLAKEYELLLLAHDGRDGVDPHGVVHKKIVTPKGRAARISVGWIPYFTAAIKSNAPVCIFHDPEFITAGILLKLCGRKVVMDIHEQLHLQIMTKPWIAECVKPTVAKAAKTMIRGAAEMFDLVLTATPAINRDIGRRGVTLRNYPVEQEYLHLPSPTGNDVCYIGTVSASRGTAAMAKAARLAEVTLHIAGDIEDEESRRIIKDGRKAGKIKYYGRLGGEDLLRVMAKCKAGLCLLSSEGGYPMSIPIKLFEYMAAGLEVVATDIPYWRRLTQNCSEVHFVKEGDACAAAEQIKKAVRIPGEHRRELLKKFCWEGEGVRLMAAVKGL